MLKEERQKERTKSTHVNISGERRRRRRRKKTMMKEKEDKNH